MLSRLNLGLRDYIWKLFSFPSPLRAVRAWGTHQSCLYPLDGVLCVPSYTHATLNRGYPILNNSGIFKGRCAVKWHFQNRFLQLKKYSLNQKGTKSIGHSCLKSISWIVFLIRNFGSLFSSFITISKGQTSKKTHSWFMIIRLLHMLITQCFFK